MSVLLFGGTIVYSFLFCNKRVAINIILPIICLLGYTYFNHDSTGYKIENWKINGFVCNPLLRGICGISLGVLIGYVTNLKSKILNEYSRVLDVGVIMSFIFVTIFCFSDIYVDNLAIFFFVVLITGCLVKTSILHKIFNSKIWLSGGSITYSMLLLHFPIIVIFRKMISNLNVVCRVDIIVYILFVILSSLIYDRLFKKVISK